MSFTQERGRKHPTGLPLVYQAWCFTIFFSFTTALQYHHKVYFSIEVRKQFNEATSVPRDGTDKGQRGLRRPVSDLQHRWPSPSLAEAEKGCILEPHGDHFPGCWF
jgi:hypothetical protein